MIPPSTDNNEAAGHHTDALCDGGSNQPDADSMDEGRASYAPCFLMSFSGKPFSMRKALMLSRWSPWNWRTCPAFSSSTMQPLQLYDWRAARDAARQQAGTACAAEEDARGRASRRSPS